MLYESIGCWFLFNFILCRYVYAKLNHGVWYKLIHQVCAVRLLYNKLNENVVEQKILYVIRCTHSNAIQVSVWHNDDILFNGPFRFRLTCPLFPSDICICVKKKRSTNHINIHHLGISFFIFVKTFGILQIILSTNEVTTMPK